MSVKRKDVKKMAFTRKTLQSYGLSDEQIEKIMTLHGTSMADFIPKSDVQAQIEAAKAEAGKNVDISNNADYLKVVGERDMLRAIGGKDFESVKPKFKEQVYNMIDRAEGAKALNEQLQNIQKDYEEYFIKKAEANEPQPKTPQFGSSDTGRMPSGEEKPTFESLWGFKKSK